MDVLCQAKSGMGKTAVFVLATLQQLEPVDGQVSVLVMCHTRELAFQISKEYERFSKYMSTIKVSVISLTEEMVYEMNRSGSGSGYAGLDAAYHNYGMDMESWKSDKYSQGRFKRGSSSSSGGGTVPGGGQ